MADAKVEAQNPDMGGEGEPKAADAATTMDLENSEQNSNEESKDAPNLSTKRAREDIDTEGDDAVLKKQRPDESGEGEKLEVSKEDNETKEGEEGEGKEGDSKVEDVVSVGLGPKNFGSSVEMFDYFVKFLHFWPPNLNVNKYEYMVLLDLLSKGHSKAEEKIGGGISSFQIRYHPMWKSRCFFLLREDGFVDDFSFRKCIDNILPLPENMKAPNTKQGNERKSDAHRGGGGRRGGRGGRAGGGRGGRAGHSRK